MITGQPEKSQFLIASKWGGETIHQVSEPQESQTEIPRTQSVHDVHQAIEWANANLDNPIAFSLQSTLRKFLVADTSPSSEIDSSVKSTTLGEKIYLSKKEDEVSHELIEGKYPLLILCDGVSSEPKSGEFAQWLAHEMNTRVKEIVQKHLPSMQFLSELRSLVVQVNKEALQAKDGGRSGASTLLLSILYTEPGNPASRAWFIVGVGNGSIIRLNGIEVENLSPEQDYPQGTNALPYTTIPPIIKIIPYSEGDQIFMATDGLDQALFMLKQVGRSLHDHLAQIDQSKGGESLKRLFSTEEMKKIAEQDYQDRKTKWEQRRAAIDQARKKHHTKSRMTSSLNAATGAYAFQLADVPFTIDEGSLSSNPNIEGVTDLIANYEGTIDGQVIPPFMIPVLREAHSELAKAKLPKPDRSYFSAYNDDVTVGVIST